MVCPRNDGSVIQGSFPCGLSRIVSAQRAVRQPHAPLSVNTSVPRHAVPSFAERNHATSLPANLAHYPTRGGMPLPPAVLQKMEAVFRTGFAEVRILVGSHVSAIGAKAFTQGSNIHFAPGHYDPTSPRGEQILAHELTHVVQQRTGRVRNPFGAGVAVIHDPRLEIEAERMSLLVARSSSARARQAMFQRGAGARIIQRATENELISWIKTVDRKEDVASLFEKVGFASDYMKLQTKQDVTLGSHQGKIEVHIHVPKGDPEKAYCGSLFEAEHRDGEGEVKSQYDDAKAFFNSLLAGWKCQYDGKTIETPEYLSDKLASVKAKEASDVQSSSGKMLKEINDCIDAVTKRKQQSVGLTQDDFKDILTRLKKAGLSISDPQSKLEVMIWNREAKSSPYEAALKFLRSEKERLERQHKDASSKGWRGNDAGDSSSRDSASRSSSSSSSSSSSKNSRNGN